MTGESTLKTERSFFDKETRCQTAFNEAIMKYGGAYHLCTPGSKMPELLFRTADEYTTMMNFVAYAANQHPDIKILTFELMSNHVHFILLGTPDRIREFFDSLRAKLYRWFKACGRRLDLSAFDYNELIPIETLDAMRKQIAYTNRNNFVINPNESPFSYPYGANFCYFMPLAHDQQHKTLKDCYSHKRREMFHTRNVDLPLNYWVVHDYVDPLSYCAISLGESFFRDTRHYFGLISKDLESMREIAGLIGESEFYHSDELFSIAVRYSKEHFAGAKLSELPKFQKLELARFLHYDYGASNEMVAQLLSMPISSVSALFPMRSK